MIKEALLLTINILLPIPVIAGPSSSPRLFQSPQNVNDVFQPVFSLLFFAIVLFIIFVAIPVLTVKYLKAKNPDSNLYGLLNKIINLFFPEKQLHYAKKEYLMSEAEKSFFEVLKDVVKDEFYIFPQVELSRVLIVPDEEIERISKDRKEERRLWSKYFNQINGMSLDFVICDRLNTSIQLIIELDDASHNRENRKKRDEKLNSYLSQAGIPILHVKAQYTYKAQELQKTLSKYLPGLETIQAEKQVLAAITNEVKNSPTEKVCTAPGCHGTMRIRTGKDGKKYWVCSEYNKCKTAVMFEAAGA